MAQVLSNQLLRSGTSVGANSEEGQASQSEADFISTYSIACKAARETRCWLRLIAASGIVDPERIDSLNDEANHLISILTAILKKLHARQAAG